MDYKKLLSDSTISLIITLFYFIFIELFFRYVLGYRDIIIGDKNCKLFNKKENFATYKPNCELINKHWENDMKIQYSFNSFGRRDPELNSIKSKKINIASIGDSFTLGAMVPIKDNYNFSGFSSFKNKYLVHNYGVGGEDLDNIVSKLFYMEDLFSEYDYILYGLTANDFFDYILDSKSNEKNSNNLIIEFIKSKVEFSSTYKFAIHNLLSSDSIYYSIYQKQKSYAGYLNSELDKNWSKALKIFETKIKKLPYSIKSKLKIIILPQRAEVVGYRLGKYKDSFSKRLLESCKIINVDCFSPNLEQLKLLEESHFPVDGHLTIEGNRLIGKELADWAKSWGIHQKKK